MAAALKRTVTKSSKGQASQTISQQNQHRSGSSSQITAPRSDTQTVSAGIVMDIAFDFTFTSVKPVTPEGETEAESC